MLADDLHHLQDIFELDNATNDRLRAERNQYPGISMGELVFDVPNARIINASFCHPNPFGGRFNGADRGAWYAAFRLTTAQQEIAYHKTIQLLETGLLEDDVTYDDYLADFSAGFHDLRDPRRYARYLAPHSYAASQKLAAELLDNGSLGVIYPSVRDHHRGPCVACFRPAVVANVRKAETWRFRWTGTERPLIEKRL